jgi:hypothetical protein
MSGLFGSSILEVAIGLVFIYFILSLICSHINEIIAGLFKWRARDLEQGIQNLLCDPETTQAVMNNPMIKAMGNTKAETLVVRLATRLRGTPIRAGKPSYISSQTFVEALFDQLAPAMAGPITVERIQRGAWELVNTTLDEVNVEFAKLYAAPTPPGATPQKNLAALKMTLTPQQQLKVKERVDGKQTIGHAILSLIDQSNPSQKAPVTVGDVQALIARLAESQQKLADAVAQAQSLDEIRVIARASPESNLRMAVLDLLEKGPPNLEDVQRLVARLAQSFSYDQLIAAAAHPEKTLDAIRKNLLTLPESSARTAVVAFIDQGQASLEDARKSVEVWYDDAMDRVSGIYKRRIQYWLFVIAAVLVVSTGADTLQIVHTLSINQTLRSSLAAEANRAVEAARSAAPDGSFALPVNTNGRTTTTTVRLAASGTMTTTTITTAVSDTSALVDELNQFSQLLGYADSQALGAGDPWSQPSFWRRAFQKYLGLLITTFAVSLGAPFWFDLLQKVSNIRAAGPPPEKAEPNKQG